MAFLRVLVLVAASGCGFSVSLDGLYRCGPGGSCPSGLVCASDSYCRSVGGVDSAPADGAFVPLDAAVGQTGADLAVASAVDSAVAGSPDLAHATGTCTPATCSVFECGVALDGCGATVSCGACNGNKTCGVGGPNACGKGTCTPLGCAAQNAECGLVSDTCSTVINCGSCTVGKTCGAQVPNRCD